MIPVSQLRLELETLPKSDIRPHNEIAVANCKRVLDVMEAQNLDATRVTYSVEGGLGIIWQSIFTPGRYVHIECTNDGAVCGVRTDANLKLQDPNHFRFWWIGELCPVNWNPAYTGPGPGELNLTTEETIEHIRCFIWADYK